LVVAKRRSRDAELNNPLPTDETNLDLGLRLYII